MEWNDEGLIIGVRKHGETGAIVDVLSRVHGRHAGFVHGAASRRLRPVVQLGNHVDVAWKGRLADQLGYYSLELRRGFAAEAMSSPIALAGLTSLTSLMGVLPERDPFPNLFEITMFVMSFLDDDEIWPALYARWELGLLEELGFGLDLTKCAATGVETGLRYVSPRSGRAVSSGAGEPYRDRLFELPAFLSGASGADVTLRDVVGALEITGFFLQTRVYQPREAVIADARTRLVDLLRRKSQEPN